MRKTLRATIPWMVAALVAAAAIFVWIRASRQPIVIRGVVLRQDADPRKQLPIADAAIVVTSGPASSGSAGSPERPLASARSDAAGAFLLRLPRSVGSGKPLTLSVRHPAYRPLDRAETAGERIWVARLAPSAPEASAEANPNAVRIANVSLRYSVKTSSEVNVGSAVKAFEVVNAGNVPCNGHAPCSPDGRWKAATASATLDAGEGNYFRNARLSCIAGPCPFTRTESDNLNNPGRTLKVTVLDWSDTATFLLEAEVFHGMVSDLVRNSFPVIFGRALNFTLPPEAEGPSIIAEVGGQSIVFPLGPRLTLSWANCSAHDAGGRGRSFRCELKPGYKF